MSALSPYVVFRRSRLPVSVLEPFRAPRTWDGVDALAARRDHLAEHGRRLADLIGDEVPAHEPPVRAEVLALRRAVHNGRVDGAEKAAESLRAALRPDLVARVERWLEAKRSVESTEAELEELYRHELDGALADLPEILRHDAVARGVQLSGERLFADLSDFVGRDRSELKASKARARTTALLNFAWRAALKPSPFGRFTEIGAFPPDDPTAGARHRPEGGEAGDPEGDESVVRLNRLLVNWLLAALARVPGGLDVGVVVLNSTAVVTDERLSYVGVPPGGHVAGEMSVERVLGLRRDATVDALVDVLATGPARTRDVVAAVARAVGDGSRAELVVRTLLGAGVLFHRVAVDDHDARYARGLLAAFPDDAGPELVAVREHLAELVRIEDDLAALSTEERTVALGTARTAVAGIARTADVTPPPDEVLRSLFYEDVPAHDPPRSWDGDAVASAGPALDALWDLATVLDNGQVKRASLAHFAEKVLQGRRTMPFLEFFDAYSSLSDAEQVDVVLGRGVPEADRLRRDRARALDELRSSAREEDGTLVLDPGTVSSVLGAVHDVTPTESVTFRTQFARDPAAPRGNRLVVNGVLTGYGVYTSRFGSFAGEGDGWSLRAALREDLRRRRPDATDLNGVLGFNFNLHPTVTGAVLDYPGAVSLDRRGPVLRPADLEVTIDPERRAVRLWDPRTAALVDLVPLNFLTPVGVPLLYRLLEAMSPSTRYLWRPVDDLGMVRLGADGLPASSPRLRVGEVVAERTSWSFAAEEVPGLATLGRGDLRSVREFDEWRRARGLPRHAFVLCQTLGERDVMAGRGRTATRSVADFSHLRRASVHKPMYVDFRDPSLLQSFSKSAASRPGVVVEVRECLPAPTDYDEATPAAEEYFVQLWRDA